MIFFDEIVANIQSFIRIDRKHSNFFTSRLQRKRCIILWHIKQFKENIFLWLSFQNYDVCKWIFINFKWVWWGDLPRFFNKRTLKICAQKVSCWKERQGQFRKSKVVECLIWRAAIWQLFFEKKDGNNTREKQSFLQNL